MATSKISPAHTRPIRLLISFMVLVQIPLSSFQNSHHYSEPENNPIVTAFTYYPDGKIASLTDPRGKVTNFTYDENSHLISITDGIRDRVTTFGYDPTGYLNAITDANGNTRRYAYDSSAQVFTSYDALGNPSSFALDEASRITKVVDPENNGIKFAYDENDNVIEIETGTGSIQFQYDANNRLQKLTDENGITTNSTYDAAGNLLVYEDGEQKTSKFEYDKNGLLVKSTDPLGHTTRYKYDLTGRLIALADPLGDSIEYAYDANGNLRMRKDPQAGILEFQYDNRNYLINIQSGDGETVSIGYDAAGNLTKATNEAAAITFQYDPLNQLQSFQDGTGKEITYSYDKSGNVTSVAYPPSGDMISRLKSFFGFSNRISYQFEANNRLASISAVGVSRLSYALDYDKAGRLIRLGPDDAGNGGASGVTTNYDYGNSFLLQEMTLSSAGNELEGYAYRYDTAGNIVSLTDLQGTTHFEYDNDYRLKKATLPDGKDLTYSYDEAGNIIESGSTSAVRTYSYNEANQLLGSSDGTSFAYDKNGNLVTKKTADGTTTYKWNTKNQLVRIDYPDKTYSAYKYDGLGRRISKTDRQGKVTNYLYDGDSLAQKLDDNGRILASYTPGFSVDHPFSVYRNGANYYYMYDRLGSVIGLVDEKGNQVASYKYDPWGNMLEKTEAFSNDMLFTGALFDEDSGLYYLRARYYDPQVGRFISRDSVAELIHNVPNQNRYLYVENNPTNYVDPYGLQGELVDPGASSEGNRKNPVDFWGYMGNEIRNVRTRVDEKSKALTVGKTAEYLIDPIIDLTPANDAYTRTKRIRELVQATQNGEDLTVLGKIFFPSMIDDVVKKTTAVNAISVSAEMGTSAAIFCGLCGIPVAGATYYAMSVPMSMVKEAVGEEIVDQLSRVDLDKVGGISLNKSAQLMIDINEIQGAVYDASQQQLILIGQTNSSLPPMSMDDLAVAIRAVYGGTDPAISIDPGPTDREMVVRYFGRTENTEFGRVMFESDRLLKTLSMGQDNITQQEMHSRLPGFKTEVELATENIDLKREESVWHRLWFYPKEMVVSRTEAGMVFDKASLEVKSEYLPPYQELGSDPAALEFAEQLTQHYDELAKEYPDLDKLRQLAKIVSIVKWLKDSQIPVDMAQFEQYQIKKVTTPTTTPTQTVWGKDVQIGMWIVKVGLFGGVDFSFDNTYNDNQQLAAPLIQEAIQTRPEGSAGWNFNLQGKNYRAVAVSLGQNPQPGNLNFSAAAAAGNLSSIQGLNLPLMPHYDTFDYAQPTEFGYGWKVLPYELRFPHPESVFQAGDTSWRYKFLLYDNLTGQSYEYGLGQDANGNLVYISPDNAAPAIDLDSDGSFRATGRDGTSLQFDRNGALTTITRAASDRVDFEYAAHGPTSIKTAAGQSLSFAYDSQGRIDQIEDSLNRKTYYEYDSGGTLTKSTDARGNSMTYAYDQAHHLVGATDHLGQSVFRAEYDDLGRILNLVDANGQEYSISYDSTKHTMSVKDSYGRQILYGFDDQNRVIRISDQAGGTKTFQYGSWKLPISITDLMGHRTDLEYDAHGNIVRLTSYLQSSTAASQASSVTDVPDASTPDSSVTATNTSAASDDGGGDSAKTPTADISTPTSAREPENPTATPVAPEEFQQMSGAIVAANEFDKYVLAMGNRILVVNNLGGVWAHDFRTSGIGEPYELSSPQVAVNEFDKYVLAMRDRILVVNDSAEVWAHDITSDTVGDAYYLATLPIPIGDIKTVLTMDARILVVSHAGEVWALDVAADSTGEAYQLSGPAVAGDAADRFVLTVGDRIVVANEAGGLWAHDTASDSIGDAYYLMDLPISAGDVKTILSIDGRILVVSYSGDVWVSGRLQ